MMGDEVKATTEMQNRLAENMKSFEAEIATAKKLGDDYAEQLRALSAKKGGVEKLREEQMKVAAQLSEKVGEANSKLAELKAKQEASSDDSEKAAISEQVANAEAAIQEMKTKFRNQQKPAKRRQPKSQKLQWMQTLWKKVRNK